MRQEIKAFAMHRLGLHYSTAKPSWSLLLRNCLSDIQHSSSHPLLQFTSAIHKYENMCHTPLSKTQEKYKTVETFYWQEGTKFISVLINVEYAGTLAWTNAITWE